MEERVSRLEGAYEQVDRRLGDLNSQIVDLRSEIAGLRSEMNGRFNNMYMLMGGLWATMVAGIVATVLTN